MLKVLVIGEHDGKLLNPGHAQVRHERQGAA